MPVHKSGQREPARTGTAAERLTGLRIHLSYAGKDRLPARHSVVPVKDNMAVIPSVCKAGAKVLVAIAVPITEGNRCPASVVAVVLGKDEQTPSGCKPSPIHKLVHTGLLMNF